MEKVVLDITTYTDLPVSPETQSQHRDINQRWQSHKKSDITVRTVTLIKIGSCNEAQMSV